jgi:hypothetical protein
MCWHISCEFKLYYITKFKAHIWIYRLIYMYIYCSVMLAFRPSAPDSVDKSCESCKAPLSFDPFRSMFSMKYSPACPQMLKMIFSIVTDVPCSCFEPAVHSQRTQSPVFPHGSSTYQTPREQRIAKPSCDALWDACIGQR